jgi:energy-coupling factor transporter ATP-binding protein EcfA2
MAVHTVLLSGKQGSGKSTLAAALERRLQMSKGWRVFTINFADSIYAIHDYARGYLQHRGFPPTESCKIKDGNLLQFLGTEWGRKTYGDDVWVRVLLNKIDETVARLGSSFENYVFIVGDCRFRNEFDACPGALRIRLEASREVRKRRVSMWRENDTHLSETDLDQYADDGLFDLYFGTELGGTDETVEVIFEKLKERSDARATATPY